MYRSKLSKPVYSDSSLDKLCGEAVFLANKNLSCFGSLNSYKKYAVQATSHNNSIGVPQDYTKISPQRAACRSMMFCGKLSQQTGQSTASSRTTSWQSWNKSQIRYNVCLKKGSETSDQLFVYRGNPFRGTYCIYPCSVGISYQGSNKKTYVLCRPFR